jgi:hypothetical protein
VWVNQLTPLHGGSLSFARVSVSEFPYSEKVSHAVLFISDGSIMLLVTHGVPYQTLGGRLKLVDSWYNTPHFFRETA